jgi:hypothetical protein
VTTEKVMMWQMIPTELGADVTVLVAPITLSQKRPQNIPFVKKCHIIGFQQKYHFRPLHIRGKDK